MTTHPDATRTLAPRLEEGIWQALQERCRRSGKSLDHVLLALPDTPAFLAADLRGDPSASLARAEGDHP